MLIDFNYIVKKYGRPKGIIHIGAHLAEERGVYVQNNLNNTIWIEANPKIFQHISYLNNVNNGEMALNYLISDIDDKEYVFNVTNNGQSSSILDLDKHKIHHPHIFVSEQLNIKSKRMDTIINQNSINISDFDFINLDIQGAELLALKSFGNLIHNFKFIYTEVNMASIYKDCVLISELDNYLSKFNFKRAETEITEYEWGDALYIKND
jgi:FkbM family methyltransferase